jgi:hypothetical protein
MKMKDIQAELESVDRPEALARPTVQEWRKHFQ